MDLYQKKVRDGLARYLSRFYRTSHEIEDVVQEAFLRVLEAGAKGEIHCPEAYLYRTAHNVALNNLGAKANTSVDSIEDLVAPDVYNQSGTLDDHVIAQERFEQFCRAVARLPEQCRQVMVLRKVYGYSQKEVARSMGISSSTVEKHVAKGLHRCKEYLDSRTETVPESSENVRNRR